MYLCMYVCICVYILRTNTCTTIYRLVADGCNVVQMSLPDQLKPMLGAFIKLASDIDSPSMNVHEFDASLLGQFYCVKLYIHVCVCMCDDEVKNTSKKCGFGHDLSKM